MSESVSGVKVYLGKKKPGNVIRRPAMGGGGSRKQNNVANAACKVN